MDKLSLPADPDTMDREPTPPYRAQLRAFVFGRFPDLKDAPVSETRVCQYENTETGNYLVDRTRRWRSRRKWTSGFQSSMTRFSVAM